MAARKASWTNGKRTITGTWEYINFSRQFHFVLDSRDPVTGLIREFWIKADSPEWGNWKLNKADKR
jgi:hypothetical protein